jgi:hypothetical protein
MKAARPWRSGVWSASGSLIRQLVGSVPKKKTKAKRPKSYAKLSQKEKFIAAAKEFEADETGETFDRTFKAIAKHKPASKPRG